MKCPICKKEICNNLEKDFLPFCSKRCHLLDLGDWLAESYSLKDNDSNLSVYENPKKRS